MSDTIIQINSLGDRPGIPLHVAAAIMKIIGEALPGSMAADPDPGHALAIRINHDEVQQYLDNHDTDPA